MQELRLFETLGDAMVCGIVGSTPNTYSGLCGSKSNGTDAHSLTAKMAGCSRDLAKNGKYASIYLGSGDTIGAAWSAGGGDLSENQRKANNFISIYRGKRNSITGGYTGGQCSLAFNDQKRRGLDARVPRDLVAGNAIAKGYWQQQGKATTKANWIIQAAGTAMMDRFLMFLENTTDNTKQHLVLTRHDEARFLVKKDYVDTMVKKVYQAYANSWHCFVESVGCVGLPLEWANPEQGVDIDHCVRKDVFKPSITPTTPQGFKKGVQAYLTEDGEVVYKRVENKKLTIVPELDF